MHKRDKITFFNILNDNNKQICKINNIVKNKNIICTFFLVFYSHLCEQKFGANESENENSKLTRSLLQHDKQVDCILSFTEILICCHRNSRIL